MADKEELPVIDDFETPPNDYLSNMYSASFEDELGTHWHTSEHYYQGHKMIDIYNEEVVRNEPCPFKAKELANSLPRVDNWDKIKVGVMREALKYKFDQNPDLREKLEETEGIALVEGNDWDDTFWGVCNGEGQNMLGILLMELRHQYLTEG